MFFLFDSIKKTMKVVQFFKRLKWLFSAEEPIQINIVQSTAIDEKLVTEGVSEKLNPFEGIAAFTKCMPQVIAKEWTEIDWEFFYRNKLQWDITGTVNAKYIVECGYLVKKCVHLDTGLSANIVFAPLGSESNMPKLAGSRCVVTLFEEYLNKDGGVAVYIVVPKLDNLCAQD
jgi:hypothetical protein